MSGRFSGSAVESGQRVCYKRHSLRGYVLSMFTTEYHLLSRLQYCIASCLGLTRLGTGCIGLPSLPVA